MHPQIEIFGKSISTYGVIAYAGLWLVVLYTYLVNRKSALKKDFSSRALYVVFGAVFGGIGAFILYEITMLKYTLEGFKYIFTDFEKFKSFLSGGIVFYGGMIGIFIGTIVYTKVFREDTREWIMTNVPAIPMFHALGRVGCLFGGCCFGVVDKVTGVVGEYNADTGFYERGANALFHGRDIYNAQIGHYCMPIQLYESIGLVLIFIILLVNLFIQGLKPYYYRPMGIYFVLYGTLRFILEFWRGDLIRGIWGPFSTSQWISLAIIPFGLYCLICPTSKNILEKAYTAKPKKNKNTENKSNTEDNNTYSEEV